MRRTTCRSPLALAILTLLIEEPMHPYRMQQLIKERDKDDVINVRQRASLYQTIARLLRAGLIEVQETAKTENRPERTVYRVTERGRETAHDWMRAMLATPVKAFPEFPAALAHLPLLSPAEALQQLTQRAAALETEIAELDARQQVGAMMLPRVLLIEGEYLRAMRHAELAWVNATIEDLRAGRLTWSFAALAEQFARLPASTATERRRS